MLFDLTNNRYIDGDFNTPFLYNDELKYVEDKLFFILNRYKTSYIIIPTILDNSYKYEWYINDEIYSTSKTIVIIPDILDYTVKLDIKNDLDEILYTYTATYNNYLFNKNVNSNISRSYNNIKFNMLYDTATEKIINIINNNELIDNKYEIGYALSDYNILKNSLSVDKDFTIEKLHKNIFKLYNFVNDFGVLFNNIELWFNITSKYRVIFINHLLRSTISYDTTNLKVLNNLLYFYDPINSVIMSNVGNVYEKTNNTFNLYTEQIIESSEEDTQLSYIIDNYGFNISSDTYITDNESLSKSKSIWEHTGYVLHSDGIIEVCTNISTSFKHKDIIIEDVTSVLVQNNTNYCLNIQCLIDDEWKNIMIPPSQELTTQDYIKVSDKISFNNILTLDIENNKLLHFTENTKVYYKPYIPGCIKINNIYNYNGSFILQNDKDILLTTNEEFSANNNDVLVALNNNTIVVNNKLYNFDNDIVLKKSDTLEVYTESEYTINYGITTIDGTLHYESNDLNISPITDWCSHINDVRISKIINNEMKHKKMRVFDYNKMFIDICSIKTSIPILSPFKYFINCSYKIIYPSVTESGNTIGTFDNRYLVV